MYSSPSNGDDGASAFNTVNANDASTSNRVESSNTAVDMILEDGLDDGQDNIDLRRSVRVNLSTRLSNASNDADLTYQSGLCNLVIDTEDQGQPKFVITVRALGNGSSTPLDKTQNVSFGENNVGELTVDDDEAEGHDPFDPVVIPMLTTCRNDSRAIPSFPRSPTLVPRLHTSVRFNDAVAECPPENTTVALSVTSSTATVNAGGTGATSSSQGHSQLSQSGLMLCLEIPNQMIQMEMPVVKEVLVAEVILKVWILMRILWI